MCRSVVLILLCFCLSAVLAPWTGEAAPTVQQGYQSATSRLNALEKNPRRARFRDNWLRCADAFDRLYASNPGSELRPEILFQSARSHEGLSRHSHNQKDVREAVARYKKLAASHPQSDLADNALLAAARLSMERLKDSAAAYALLKQLLQRYPKGDCAEAAKALFERLPPPGASSADNEEQPSRASVASARLNKISWTPRKNSANISVSLSSPVAWAVYSQPPSPKTGQPARIIIELPGVSPAKSLVPGARIRRGILKRMRVRLSNTGVTRIVLDFSSFRKYTVKDNGSSLVISVSNVKGALPQGRAIGESIGSPRRRHAVPRRVPSDLARQLGLDVRTIVLDPGHGGKDGGTAHNDIIEKNVTLDMAKRVAAQLERLGYTVRLTRNKDRWLSLEDRVEIANKAKADLFVSIHINANTKCAISGFETYYLNFASSKASARLAAAENILDQKNPGKTANILADFILNVRTQESRKLASAIQQKTLSHMRRQHQTIRNGGVRSAPFFVLIGSRMPGVLIELGYCTNAKEAQKLKRADFRNALAKGIANGIKAYADALSSGN